ncbi:MAG TPA: PadR family transcriptional regulator [Longimicrobiales bacterium]|nr:PadR family transcriptional regulator [Longimicrobiales bacterium]
MKRADRGLLHGTVELLVLRTLADDAMHGLAVSRALRARSDGVVVLKDAALYQALHRMERQGLVESRWGLSEKGKRAKFYRITEEGRTRLEREASAWRRYAAAVSHILDPGRDAGAEGA